MYAIIQTKGSQHLVTPGKEYLIPKIDEKEAQKKKIIFSEVLLYSNDSKILIGQPTVEGVTVLAEIICDERSAKVNVFKFHSKKRYARTRGHRQEKTRIKILKINVKDNK